MSKQVKAVVITPEGEVEERTIATDLDTLKDIVGGWIEGIGPSHSEFGEWHAYCNEEGKMINLPFNRKATELAHYMGWPLGDVLCGTVVFLGDGTDGDEADIPEATLSQSRVLFDSWHA